MSLRELPAPPNLGSNAGAATFNTFVVDSVTDMPMTSSLKGLVVFFRF